MSGFNRRGHVRVRIWVVVAEVVHPARVARADEDAALLE
jgi:hypothetical protein